MFRNLIKSNEKFLKHGLFSYIVIAINILITIIVIKQLLIILTPNIYGVWIIVFNIITILSLLHFGFTAICLFKFKDYVLNNNLKIFFSRNMFVIFFQTTIILLFLTLIYFNLDILIKHKSELILAQNMLLCATPGLVFNAISAYFESILYYNLKFIYYRNFLELVRLGIFYILSLVGVLYFNNNPILIPLTYTFLSIITFCYTIYKFNKNVAITIEWKEIKSDYLKDNFKDGFSFWILSFSSFVIAQTDVFFISSYKNDLSLVTMYAQSFRLQDIFLRFIKKITEIKGPKILSLYQAGNHLGVYNIYIKLLKINIILSLLACFIIAILGKIILEYWLDYSLIFDQTLISVLSILCVTGSIHWVFWNFCNITEQQNKIKYISFLEILLNLLLSYFLIRHIGLIGLGIASLISNSITITFMIRLFKIYKYKS